MASKEDKFIKEFIEKYGVCGETYFKIPKYSDLTLWEKIKLFFRKLMKKQNGFDYFLHKPKRRQQQKVIKHHQFESIGEVIRMMRLWSIILQISISNIINMMNIYMKILSSKFKTLLSEIITLLSEIILI